MTAADEQYWEHVLKTPTLNALETQKVSDAKEGQESEIEARQRAIGEHVATVIADVCPDTTNTSSPGALGELLLEFLSFFGESFDTTTEGVSLRDGAFLFKLTTPSQAHGIVIEDPLCLRNNVGRTCYRAGELQLAFASMKHALDIFPILEADVRRDRHPLVGRGGKAVDNIKRLAPIFNS